MHTAVYHMPCQVFSRLLNFSGVNSANTAIAMAKSMPYAAPTKKRPTRMTSKLGANITSSAPITARNLAMIKGRMRPQRSAIHPPMGLKAMATHAANDVISATCPAVKPRSRVMGPNAALKAELAKASRNSPPSASHQIRPARPVIPGRESI
ncbi:hypothetical protein D3C71_1282140 [compost metagenome]